MKNYSSKKFRKTLFKLWMDFTVYFSWNKYGKYILVATMEIIWFSPLRQKLQFENGRKCWNWLFSKIETATRTLFVNHYLFTCGALPIYGEIKIDFFTLLQNWMKLFLKNHFCFNFHAFSQNIDGKCIIGTYKSLKKSF